jgi:hypothetical protein
MREYSPSGSTTGSSGRFPLTPGDGSEASSTSASSPKKKRFSVQGHARKASGESAPRREVSGGTVRAETEGEKEARRKDRRRSEANAAIEVGALWLLQRSGSERRARSSGTS